MARILFASVLFFYSPKDTGTGGEPLDQGKIVSDAQKLTGTTSKNLKDEANAGNIPSDKGTVNPGEKTNQEPGVRLPDSQPGSTGQITQEPKINAGNDQTKSAATTSIGADLTEDEAEEKYEGELLKKYGPGYVRARKGEQLTTFSKLAWEMLGDNKEGWKKTVKTPPEVEALQRGENVNV